jgi:hypothetical protein
MQVKLLDDAAPGWMRLLLLAAVYFAFSYVFTWNRPFPWHPDDYMILGGRLADLGLFWKRPVLANVIFLMGASGQVASYVFLNAMAVLVPWLALRFLERVFAVRLSLPATALFAVLVFAHATAFEHGKYLGLISNLLSHALGLGAMLFAWQAWRGGARWHWFAAAGLYLLAVFAKEDFVLPPLLLLGALWLGLRERPAPLREWRRYRARVGATLAFATIGAGSMAWNALDANPFVAALFVEKPAHYPYAVDLRPYAVARNAWTLLAGYVPLASASALATWLLSWWRFPAWRRALAFFAVSVGSLVLPYALIPNNMPPYRAYAWLPWLAAMVAIALQAHAPVEPHGSTARRRHAVWLGACGIVALATALAYYPARQRMAQDYAAGERPMRAMVAALERVRPHIADAPMVGLAGLQGRSPWCNNDALYVNAAMGFEQKWVVFADAETDCYRNLSPDPRRKRGMRMQVMPTARMCDMQDLPVLHFAADGSAVLRSGRDFCPQR